MMKKEIEAIGRIEDDGSWKIYNTDFFKSQVSRNFKGRKVKILVREYEKERSNPQLRYYYGVIVKMIRSVYLEAGYKRSVEEVSDTLRENWLYKEEVDFISGEVKHRKKSLKSGDGEVTTKEMKEFFETIQQWAAEELDLYIPDPNEEIFEEQPNNKT